MQYRTEFALIPKEIGGVHRSMTKPFRMRNDMGIEEEHDNAVRHMRHHALQYMVDHPNEQCTVKNIYRLPAGETPVLIYPAKDEQ